ncbi:hypothetical protein UJ101_00804 [Flavobacteriaceae bacterium UJ101]|nr:hypothetical protein UJ101_00804 [Flavobacteriaceae bacterium UJ101]
MKKITFLVCWISLILHANFKPTWGKISQEEKNYKICNFEKEANAVILAEKGKMYVNYDGVSSQVFRRIKILDPKGIESGTIEIKFQAENDFEEIRNLKAQVFYPDDYYQKPITLSAKDFYLKDVTKTWKKYEFTFPGLKKGCIIEYQYTLHSKNVVFLETWEFQHEIPTEYSEFNVEIEDKMSYRPIVQGRKLLNKMKNEKRSQSKWILEQVQSYSDIAYTYNIRDYINKISFQLENYGYSGTTFVSKWKDLLRTVDGEYKPYYRSKPLQEVLSKVKKSNDSLQYLKNIVQYFDSHYAWNSKNIIGASLSKSQKEVLNFKKGSRSELNVLLNALIKEAGFKTDLVLIGQRYYGRPIVSYPSLQQFTGGLTVVYLNGGGYLFDATNLNQYPFGYAPPENYNYLGLVIGKEEKWVEPRMLLSEIIETQYYDYNAKQYSKKTVAGGYFVENEDVKKEGVKDAIDKEDWNKLSEEKNIKGNKIKLNQTYVIEEENDMIFIQNPLASLIRDYDFNEENRFAPFEFEFPYAVEVRVIIKSSESTKIKNSENFSDKMLDPELGLLYSQKIEEKTNSILLNYKFVFYKTVIPENKQKELKSFFEKLQVKLNNQIMLFKE